MPRPCSVCSHPKHAEILAALEAGGTIRDTAKAFGVSEDALTRCRASHSAEPKPASAAPETEAPETADTQSAPRLDDSPASGLIARLDREIAETETARDQLRRRVQDLARDYVNARTPQASSDLDNANAEAAGADALLVALRSKRAEEAERLRVQLEQEASDFEARMAQWRAEKRQERMDQIATYNTHVATFADRLVDHAYPRLREALQTVLDVVAEGAALTAGLGEEHKAACEAASLCCEPGQEYGPDRPRVVAPPTREDVVRALLRHVPNKLAAEFVATAATHQAGSDLQHAAMIVVPRRNAGPWERTAYREGWE